jgi:hypothetical protein
LKRKKWVRFCPKSKSFTSKAMDHLHIKRDLRLHLRFAESISLAHLIENPISK